MPALSSSRGLVVALLLLAASAPLAAQPAACAPQLIGADRRGPAQAISRSGNTLYLGAGAAVVVVDTSDLLDPVERGYVNLDELVLDVAHWQTTAIALGETGLSFIDASDPAQPSVVGTFPFPTGWVVNTATAREWRAYVPESNGLHVLDFSDPSAPFEIGGFPASNVRDVVLNGDRAYLLAGTSLRVLDISNPALPSQIASVGGLGIANWRLAIAGNGSRLATYGGTCQSHHCWGGVTFFSLADADLPVARGGLARDWTVSIVALVWGRAYVDNDIYDLSDLSNPVYRGELQDHLPSALAASPDPELLLIADLERGLVVAAVGDPTNPQVAASVGMPGATTDGYVAGEMAVALDSFGLRTFDLSDPSRPIGVGSVVQPEAYFERAARGGDHAFVTANDFPEEVRIFDVSDPGLVQQVGSVPWNFGHPLVSAGVLFVYDAYGQGLALYDVTDPPNPLRVSSIGYPGTGEFAASGRRLHLWRTVGSYPNYGSVLHQFDVTNPASPIELGEVELPYLRGGETSARGNRALVARWDQLDVLDVRIPAAPTLLASLPLSGAFPNGHRRLAEYGAMALVTTPGYDYLPNSDDHVRVIDLTDPTSPFEVASLDTPGDGRGVFAGPGVIVVADGPAGFSVFSSCVPFADGFEGGDTSEWSDTQP